MLEHDPGFGGPLVLEEQPPWGQEWPSHARRASRLVHAIAGCLDAKRRCYDRCYGVYTTCLYNMKRHAWGF